MTKPCTQIDFSLYIDVYKLAEEHRRLEGAGGEAVRLYFCMPAYGN